MSEIKKQAQWEDADDFDSDEGEAEIGLTPTTTKNNEEMKNNQDDGNNSNDQGLPVVNQGSQGKQHDVNISSFEGADQMERPSGNDRLRKNDQGDRRRNNRDYDRGKRDYNNDRNNDGGHRRKQYDREPRERKNFEFNPNSNFRLYYLNDPQFYEVVIRKEEPPYDFKIHLFLDNNRGDDSRG